MKMDGRKTWLVVMWLSLIMGGISVVLIIKNGTIDLTFVITWLTVIIAAWREKQASETAERMHSEAIKAIPPANGVTKP